MVSNHFLNNTNWIFSQQSLRLLSDWVMLLMLREKTNQCHLFWHPHGQALAWLNVLALCLLEIGLVIIELFIIYLFFGVFFSDSRAGEGTPQKIDHAVIGGVVAVVMFAILCALIVLGRYFARHKGKARQCNHTWSWTHLRIQVFFVFFVPSGGRWDWSA